MQIRKSRLVKHNLKVFLIPVLIPILVLGSLSVLITQYYIKNEIDRSSGKLLTENMDKIELMLNTIDTVNVNFSLDVNVTVSLKRIFNSGTLSAEDIAQVDMLKSLLSGPVDSGNNIDSIYVYFENENKRFISTWDGMGTIPGNYDKGWYDAFLRHRENKSVWCEVRTVRHYGFENPIPVLSVYKNISVYDSPRSIGIIVLNLRLDSIRQSLAVMKTFQNQRLLLLDGQNHLICDDTGVYSNQAIDLSRIANRTAMTFKSERSAKYGLQCISIIPVSELYQVPIKLLATTVVLLLFSLFQGLILTYCFSKRNYRHISDIIRIIDSATEGRSLPSLPKRVENEYSYIEYSLIKNFIEQNYLKVQLSEKKYRMKTLELLALQSQINPHFLYNTLETINMRAFGLTGGPNEVSRMLENLSTILQYSLSDPTETSTLQKEIENTKSYIGIQQARYNDKFRVLWNCGVEPAHVKIMKLVLQPLIENSIRYGILQKEGRGAIKITIRKKPDAISVKVIDNGIGISREKLVQIREQLSADQNLSAHIGLLNTNHRLLLYYGKAHGLHIRSHFGWGTSVFFDIPNTSV
jgi:two-component system sensor histidine kinase YesM